MVAIKFFGPLPNLTFIEDIHTKSNNNWYAPDKPVNPEKNRIYAEHIGNARGELFTNDASSIPNIDIFNCHQSEIGNDIDDRQDDPVKG